MPLTDFEKEVVEDITRAIKGVEASNMDKREQIVCFAALYLFAWLSDNEKDLLRVAFANILAQLMFHV
jgi:hypothetical protein